MTWKTLTQWNKGGRLVKKGEKCRLKDPEGLALFHKSQTKKADSSLDSDSGFFGYGVYHDYDYEYHEYGDHMYGD